MKKLMMLLLAVSLNTFASELTKEDAQFLVKLNEEAFSQKELVNNKDLCSFHAELQRKAGQSPLNCIVREDIPTKDKEFEAQLAKFNQTQNVMRGVHPELPEASQELNPDYIYQEAVKRMKVGF